MSDRDLEAETRRLAAGASEHDPTGWFERLYAAAGAGGATVPWDRGSPHPSLLEWTSRHRLDGHGLSALVVGCGLGADAEHLSHLGFGTTAFDVSPTAVDAARGRWPETHVEYTAADLLAPPDEWNRAFDLVLESLTVQSMPVSYHAAAIRNVCGFVAPEGTLLVISVAREEGSEVDGPPWPLTGTEIDSFASHGLTMQQLDLLPGSEPGLLRWRAELRRN